MKDEEIKRIYQEEINKRTSTVKGKTTTEKGAKRAVIDRLLGMGMKDLEASLTACRGEYLCR